jgi:hypothetical protein
MSAPVSAQRPMTYHLVGEPSAVLPWSSTSSQAPGGAAAVHDGTSWVAGKPISCSGEVHRTYGQACSPPSPNGSR